MFAPSGFSRAAPVAASFGVHLAVVAALLSVGPAWTARPPDGVIQAELIAEPPPAPPPEPEKPKVEKPRPEKKIVKVEPPKPVVPPRPIEPPRREVVEPPPTPAPPPPAPVPEPRAPRVESPAAAVAAEAPVDPTPRRRAELGGSAVDAVPGPGPFRPGPAASPAPPTAPTASARAVPDAPPSQLARPTGGYQVKPAYPATARRLGIEGTTLLRVYVAADGQVTDVQVDSSAGHPDLDRAAADAVRRWHFEPGRRGAEPVGMWVRLPVQFVLR